jgi:hypothetical protein
MELLFTVWGLSFLGMLGLLAYQGYLYLKLGAWISISATGACARYLQAEWCASPSDWVGVHKLLSHLNAGVFIWIVTTLVCLAIAAAAGDSKS